MPKYTVRIEECGRFKSSWSKEVEADSSEEARNEALSYYFLDDAYFEHERSDREITTRELPNEETS